MANGFRGDKPQYPRVLELIGHHREVTIMGHISLIAKLPIKQREHLALIDQYVADPGDYQGQYANVPGEVASLLDCGGGYVALNLYNDINRPQIGEFLLNKGWKMIGFATERENGKTSLVEKWVNIRDH